MKTMRITFRGRAAAADLVREHLQTLSDPVNIQKLHTLGVGEEDANYWLGLAVKAEMHGRLQQAAMFLQYALTAEKLEQR